MSEQFLFQLQSALIVLLMFYGITQRKKRMRHVKIMSAAMIWDVVLILQIELSRSAIIKTGKAVMGDGKTMLYIHLFFALSTVLLYIAMVISGRKILKGITPNTKTHKKLGSTTFSFRILTLVTSFFAVTSSQ